MFLVVVFYTLKQMVRLTGKFKQATSQDTPPLYINVKRNKTIMQQYE